MSFWERWFGPPGVTEREGGEVAPTGIQREILRVLSNACAAAGASSFEYRSDWMGYMPNPLVHWIEVGGRSVLDDLPRGWTEHDLEALVRAGAIREIARHADPEDEWDETVTYALVPAGAEPPTPPAARA